MVGNEAAPAETSVEALRRGWRLHRDGDLARAHRIYVDVLRREPANPHALNLLGRLAFDQGLPDAAVECMTRAAAAAPETAAFHYNLGLVLVSAGRMADAGDRFRTATRLKPDYAEAYNNLGNVLEALGRHDEAVACYQKAIDLRPDSADFCNNLGLTMADHGDHLDALACFLAAESTGSPPAGGRGRPDSHG